MHMEEVPEHEHCSATCLHWQVQALLRGCTNFLIWPPAFIGRYKQFCEVRRGDGAKLFRTGAGAADDEGVALSSRTLLMVWPNQDELQREIEDQLDPWELTCLQAILPPTSNHPQP